MARKENISPVFTTLKDPSNKMPFTEDHVNIKKTETEKTSLPNQTSKINYLPKEASKNTKTSP